MSKDITYYWVHRKSDNRSWIELLTKDVENALEHTRNLFKVTNTTTVTIEQFHCKSADKLILVEEFIPNNTFKMMTFNELSTYLCNIQPVKLKSDCIDNKGDDLYCTVYNIGSKYKSPKLGEDFMGSIDHWHVDNEDLNEIKEDGIKAYLKLRKEHVK